MLLTSIELTFLPKILLRNVKQFFISNSKTLKIMGFQRMLTTLYPCYMLAASLLVNLQSTNINALTCTFYNRKYIVNP